MTERAISPTSEICRRARPARGFALLEVLISITILAIVITSVLRSFSQSMAAVKKMEVRTKAFAFAQQLLDEYEVNPPLSGEIQGGFGDDYWEYSFTTRVEYEEPDYELDNKGKDVEHFIPMRLITIEIHYDNGSLKPMTPCRIETAIMGFERFTPEARRQLLLY